jgi:hypothetical protein
MDPLPQTPTPLPELLPPQKTFTPKFWGVLILIITVGAITFAGTWYWTQNQPDQMVVPTFTPRATDQESNWYSISNLGLLFNLPNTLSDLTYQVVKLSGDQAVNSVKFSTKRLESVGCNLSTDPLGYLTYDKDKGGVVVANARGSDLYYIKPAVQCETALQDSLVLEQALKTIISDACGGKESMCPSGFICKPPDGYPQTEAICQKISTDTSSWKIYTNIKYGFEFKYPASWSIAFGDPAQAYLDIELTSPETKEFFKKCQGEACGSGADAIFNVQINLSMTAEKYVKSLPVYDIKQVTFNKYTGWQYRYGGMGVDGTGYVISHNGAIYKIAIQKTNHDLEQQQILSTFKFTDSSTQAGNGTLMGHVNIGPNCPVEQVGHPCTPTPEAYTAVRIGINTVDNKQTIKVLDLDSYGNYETSLPSGKYSVGTSHNEGTLGMGADMSYIVTIEAKKTTVQNFSIDTGIR